MAWANSSLSKESLSQRSDISRLSDQPFVFGVGAAKSVVGRAAEFDHTDGKFYHSAMLSTTRLTNSPVEPEGFGASPGVSEYSGVAGKPGPIQLPSRNTSFDGQRR